MHLYINHFNAAWFMNGIVNKYSLKQVKGSDVHKKPEFMMLSGAWHFILMEVLLLTFST